MKKSMKDPNQELYCKSDVVDFYRSASDLMPPERHILARYLRDGMDVLDLGVGGGRTTPFLAPKARRYLGLDYSEAMVAACREKYPKQEFAEGDATNLSFIPDGSFDFTIFSFNGIDYIPSNEARLECLREMRRVTRNEGYVVVSSHNARVLGIYPQLEGVGLAKKAWRLARSLFMSPKVAWRTLRSPAYRTGSGFIVDSVHGGLRTHVSTKQCLSAEARAAGLKVIEIVSGYHPRQVPEWLNPWNTFVLQRTDA